MSRRFYLLFSSLNENKPKIIESRKKAEILLKNQNLTNMLSFTSKYMAKKCLEERIDRAKTISRIEDAKWYYQNFKRRNKMLYDLDEEVNGKEKAQETESKSEQQKQQESESQSVPMHSQKTLNERLSQLLSGLENRENKQLMERFKPQSIMTSIYTHQIFSSRLYKFYLSMHGKKSFETSSKRNVFAYYVTRKQQILMERTFMVHRNQYRKLQVVLKGIAYILADAWVNGMRNVQINCDDKGLFYVWQDLIQKGFIKEEQSSPMLINQKQSQTSSQEEQSSKVKQQQNDTTQQSEQTNKEVQSKNNYQQESEKKNQPKTNWGIYFQITKSEEKFALQKLNFVTRISRQIDEMDDFTDETEVISDCLSSYSCRYFKKEISTIIQLVKKMDSVKLKLLSTDQNKNAIDLVNQRLKEEKTKKVEYKKKKKQFQEMKEKVISHLKDKYKYKAYYDLNRIIQREQEKLEAEFNKVNPQFQEE